MERQRDIEQWVKDQVILRDLEFSPKFPRKKGFLEELFQMANRLFRLPVDLVVYESFYAENKCFMDKDVIAIDSHFTDITWFLAHAYYSNNFREIDNLSNLILADSLVIAGNPAHALRYARLYKSTWMANFAVMKGTDVFENAKVSAGYQMLFTMGHELAHFYYRDNVPLIDVYGDKLKEAVQEFNYEARYMNSMDLSPIKQYLDKIDRSLLDYSASEEDKMKARAKILDIMLGHHSEVDLSGIDIRRHAYILNFACENYLTNKKSKELDEQTIVTEGKCDLLSFSNLLRCTKSGKNKEEATLFKLEAYVLALLACNIVTLMRNICKNNGESIEDTVDEIYMRRTMEQNGIAYALLEGTLDDKELTEKMLGCLDEIFLRADTIYGYICDKIYNTDFSLYDDPSILMDEAKCEACYKELMTCLMIPF